MLFGNSDIFSDKEPIFREEGMCKDCIMYDLKKGMCLKYTMWSKRDQTCKSFKGQEKHDD